LNDGKLGYNMHKAGIGFDAHRFAAGRKLIIGGVEIEYNLGLEGHSDADVLIHAIMDALLGAAGLGDIGLHFPDIDMAYKDKSSLEMLKTVYRLLSKNGIRINNIDSVIIAQEPKMAPYIPKMREVISRALDLNPMQVSIKATTTERMGFTGRREGIAAQAVACVHTNQEDFNVPV